MFIMEFCLSQNSIRIAVFHRVMCSVVGRHRRFGGRCLFRGGPEIAFPEGFEISPSSRPNANSIQMNINMEHWLSDN
jgi:hypothetical protein